MLPLICGDVIRPSLSWLLTPAIPKNLAAEMARSRDPGGFAALSALARTDPASAATKDLAARRIAAILAAKGGTIAGITVGDCLELLDVLAAGGGNTSPYFYQLLHTLGIFPPAEPPTVRAFKTPGQLGIEQLVGRYPIACQPVRALIIDYLRERQPAVDHATLRSLSRALAGLFWHDLEIHHPGIGDLSWPKLQQRWTSTRTAPGRPHFNLTAEDRNAAWDHATRAAADATAQIRTLARTDPAAAADAAWATSDTLHAAATMLGSRIVRRAADAYDRAARPPYGRIPPPSPAGNQLRQAARLLSAFAYLTGGWSMASIVLITRLAALAEAVAELRETQQHAAQAAAAHAAAEQLHAAAHPAPPAQPRPDQRASTAAQLAGLSFPQSAPPPATPGQPGPAPGAPPPIRRPPPPRPRGPTR